MMSRIAIVLFCFAIAVPALGEVTAEKTDKGVTIEIDGKPYCEYLLKSGTKPIVWPIIGPSGKRMTREHPMAKGENERPDHVHHRSLWFTHGDVTQGDAKKLSFWHEKENGPTIKHREFTKVEGGKTATVATVNDWIAPGGKKVCEDSRTLTFGGDDQTRWIDFDITIKATDGDVIFGDTKEGCMGVRVPGTMKVDAKKGGKIVNSNGDTDKGAWGKEAPWVDYHGPVDGETVGIAILNHPSSFRFPSYWHVRTYGLFAANPFGLRYFKKGGANGTHTIKDGEQIDLRYRIIFHRGDEKKAKIAEAFEAYTDEKK